MNSELLCMKKDIINDIRLYNNIVTILNLSTSIEKIVFVYRDEEGIINREEEYIPFYNVSSNKFVFINSRSDTEDVRKLSGDDMIKRIEEFDTTGFNYIAVNYNMKKIFY